MPRLALQPSQGVGGNILLSCQPPSYCPFASSPPPEPLLCLQPLSPPTGSILRLYTKYTRAINPLASTSVRFLLSESDPVLFTDTQIRVIHQLHPRIPCPPLHHLVPAACLLFIPNHRAVTDRPSRLMQSMEPHDAAAGPSDRRKEPGSQQAPTEETSCVKTDTGPTKSKEPESVETSQIESKKRATGKDAPPRKSTNSTRSRNHLRAKSKRSRKLARVDNASSTSTEALELSSSDSKSDSTDSEHFTDREAPKSKKSSRGSKARPRSRKAKLQRKSSLSARAKSSAQSSSDSDSDSTTSTDSDKDKRRAGSRPHSKGTTKGDMYDHIDKLELRVSQLQSQIAQTTSFPHLGTGGLVYGMTPAIPSGIGLPSHHLGSFLPAASNGNLSNQSASFATPPMKRLGRLDLGPKAGRGFRGGSSAPRLDSQQPDTDSGNEKPRGSSNKATRKGTKVDFKRVDWVWDSSMYTYRLQDTAETSMSSSYDDYIFHVRRTFDCEGKYRATFVDIRSKLLRECLQDVIGNVRGASLVAETPKLDPNLLFLYAPTTSPT